MQEPGTRRQKGIGSKELLWNAYESKYLRLGAWGCECETSVDGHREHRQP
jgi:hypothetical protein